VNESVREGRCEAAAITKSSSIRLFDIYSRGDNDYIPVLNLRVFRLPLLDLFTVEFQYIASPVYLDSSGVRIISVSSGKDDCTEERYAVTPLIVPWSAYFTSDSEMRREPRSSPDLLPQTVAGTAQRKGKKDWHHSSHLVLPSNVALKRRGYAYASRVWFGFLQFLYVAKIRTIAEHEFLNFIIELIGGAFDVRIIRRVFDHVETERAVIFNPQNT